MDELNLTVNVEDIMREIRADIQRQGALDIELRGHDLFDREIDVAGAMREIRKSVSSEQSVHAHTIKSADEMSSQLQAVCDEIYRINSYVTNTRMAAGQYIEPGAVIPVRTSRPLIIQKIFTLIKRFFRKATRFLALDQKAYNQGMNDCVRALCESQEQVVRLAMIVSAQNAYQAERLDGAKQELERQRSELLDMMDEHENSHKNCMEEMGEEICRLKIDLSSLDAEHEKELAVLRQDWAQAEEMFRKLHGRLDELEAEALRQLHKRIDELEEGGVCQLRQRLDNLEAETLHQLYGKLDELEKGALHQLRGKLDELEKLEKNLEVKENDRNIKLQAIARDTIRTKWAFSDYMDALHDPSEEVVTCGICGHSDQVSNLEKRVSKCIFDGGELVRYVCPECGVVFGPVKFSRQSAKKRDDDYTVHYTGYHEGDSTEKEMKSFMRLEPTKEGVYLNYGCGSWSHTMQLLREQGYQVYGYEPYSKDVDNPFIISDRSRLSKMRFNGIFSNDVLEHFVDPAEELRFMKSLLATPSSMMAHTTGCYLYRYEHTRFHTFFFTGNSLDVLCSKAGLRIVEISDADSEIGEKDFHCRTFLMAEPEIDYLPMACTNQFAKQADSKIELEPDGVCCGPYIDLPRGAYVLHIDLELPREVRQIEFKVTAECGEKNIFTTLLHRGENSVEFALEALEKDVEFLIRNETNEKISIKRLALGE